MNDNAIWVIRDMGDSIDVRVLLANFALTCRLAANLVHNYERQKGENKEAVTVWQRSDFERIQTDVSRR